MSTNKQKKTLARKKQLQSRERRLRRLREHRDEPRFISDDKIIHAPPGMEKMSQVLLDFVAPFIDDAATEEAVEGLLRIAAIAWNFALFPPDRRQEFLDEAWQSPPIEDGAFFRMMIEALIERKLTCFPDNRRMILDFDLTTDTAGLHVEVRSTIPAEFPPTAS